MPSIEAHIIEQTMYYSLTDTSAVSPCSKYSLKMATACFLKSSILRCGEEGDTVYVS